MKGWLQLNKLPPSVGLKPGTARLEGQRKATELSISINKGCAGCSDYFLFTHAPCKRRLRFTISMHHTNCDDVQTDQSLFWSYFPQMNVSGKQNQSQKRCEARDVSNAQTDVSLRHSYVL